MKRIPSVKAVMTPFPYCIDVTGSMEEASRMMQEHDIRHLPVAREREIVGVVSERDVRWALDAGEAAGAGSSLRVEEVCDFGAHRVDLGERLDDVLEHMAKEHAGVALVLKQGRLVGIFTATDACRTFADHLRAEFSSGGGDSAA